MRSERARSPFAQSPNANETQRRAKTVPEPAFARTFDAEALAVRAALRAAVARFARRVGPETAGILELALAEVLNNIVEHGYNGVPAGPVRVVIGRAHGGIFCRVEDAGRPVPDDLIDNPRFEEDYTTGADAPEGGFGWRIIHALVRDVRYAVLDGHNRITFRIPLPGADDLIARDAQG